jgi:NAD(P)-dependent dehydrogenase (short-subunit alcohol dehydrogenase family)
MPGSISLRDKTALVIGASRGIGEAIARACFAGGARVVLASRDLASLDRLAAELDPRGQRVRAIRTDIKDSASVEAAVALAAGAFGRLDIAINNAGIMNGRAAFVDTADDAFDELMSVNLRGVFVAMKHELRAMLADAKGGAIVNVASAAGLIGIPFIAPYVASKHGIVGLTRAAAAEYASRGIRVNALAPGMVMTEMLKAGPASTPEATAASIARVPMARFGSVDEAAAAAVWLASDAASYVNGVALPVDGGLTMV